MPTKLVGADFPQHYARDQFRRTIYGDSILRRLRTYYETWQRDAPAMGSADTIYPYCTLADIQVEQDELDGELCDISLYYEQAPSSSEIVGTVSLPLPELSESGSAVQADIRQHPEWATGANLRQYWDFVNNRPLETAPSWFRPVTQFVVGSGQVVTTKYSRTPFDPVIALIGTRVNPDVEGPFSGGASAGESGHWLVVNASRGQRTAFYYRQLVYQYSATVWPTQLYAAGTL